MNRILWALPTVLLLVSSQAEAASFREEMQTSYQKALPAGDIGSL